MTKTLINVVIILSVLFNFTSDYFSLDRASEIKIKDSIHTNKARTPLCQCQLMFQCVHSYIIIN
jgi:hypothetical protein